MQDRRVVEVAHGKLLLPQELGRVMGLRDRDRLLLEREQVGAMLSKLELKTFAKRTLRRQRSESTRCKATSSGWVAGAPKWLNEGTYRIINYRPRFQLMQSRGGDEASDRARFWASLGDYHEHRQHETQDPSANLFSKWFAGEVVGPFDPRRVLELGCGAGRNLRHIQETIPGVEVVGIEINEAAAERARVATGATVVNRSLYEPFDDLGKFDVVFTTGVLMHVPHDVVEDVVRSMVESATRAVAHFELHGEPHTFDFHRYPRDYGDLYERLELPATYRVLDSQDPLNAGESVGQMALLTYPILTT